MSDSLLPPNATELELAVEDIAKGIAELPLPLASTWDPATTPLNTLPWLAWALSVEGWSQHWDENTKRSVVAGSPKTHQTKGTLGAVRRALSDLGVIVEIKEWWQSTNQPLPPPFTAKAIAYASRNLSSTNDTLLTPDLQRQLLEAVARTRPTRTHIDLEIGVGMSNQMHMACATSTLSCQRHTHAIVQDQIDLSGSLALSGGALHPSKTVARRTMHVFETVPVFACIGTRAGLAPTTLINRTTLTAIGEF